jgi:O-antigen/teichoic acid export membrane protein
MFASEILALLATVIAAWLTHSFTAAIWGAITRAIVFVVSTHLQAKRPYGLQWSSSDAPRFFHFALPLMLNGVMLYVGSQGDRVMVAKRLGAVTIGRYSAVLLLILYPAALLQRYMQALYMPVVAAARDHFQRRESVIDLLGGQTFLLAISMSIGFAVVAPTVVTRLYGARFTEAPLVVAMIGILQSTRFLINWPSTICLGVGHTRAVLASNIAKLLVFPGAWIGARAIGGLIGVVIGFTAGEFISVAVAVILMNRATSRPLFAGFDRLCAFLFVSAAIVGGVMAISEHSIAEETALATGFALLAAWIVRREGPTLAHALGVGERLTRRMFSKLDWAG